MTLVNWNLDLLGRFVKAIDTAKADNLHEFDFTVETRRGPAVLTFSRDYAEYLADHLTTNLAPASVQ